MSNNLKCDGLQDSSCRLGNKAINVRPFRQGDLTLCQDCETARFKPGANGSNEINDCNDGNLSDPNQPNVIPSAPVPAEDVIIDPVLSYIVFSSKCSTNDNLLKTVVGHFSNEQVLTAKYTLWNNAPSEVIGDLIRRRDSSLRSLQFANCLDVIQAVRKLDDKECMPHIVLDANDIKFLPRFKPEEIDDASIAIRMSKLEDTIADIHKAIKEIKSPPVEPRAPYSSVVSKPQNTVAPPRLYQPLILQVSTERHEDASIVNTGQNSRPPVDTRAGSRPENNPLRGRSGGRSTAFPIPRVNRIDDFRGSRASVNDLASDAGSFQYQYQERRRQRKQRNAVTGANATTCGNFRGAPEPVRDLFVYRVEQTTTLDDIKQYLTDHDIVYTNITRVSHSESKFQSFKLTVPKSRFKDLLNEDSWPTGVYVREFKQPRRQYDESH